MGSALVIGQVKEPLQWEHWGEAVALLDPALTQSDESWPDVIRELAADTMQMVAVMDSDRLMAAAVTRTALTSRGEMLEIYLCGGVNFECWAKPLASALVDAARTAGMIGTRIIGRLGWQKILADVGFRPKAIVLEAV